MRHDPSSPERRNFLRQSAGALLLLPAAAALAACGESGEKAASPAQAPPAPPAPAAPPAAAPPAAPADAAALADALVTEIPANATLVSTLQYVNVGEDPQKICTSCQLYTAVDENRGRCTLFQQGLVAAKGHCTSWIQRQG